MGLVSWYSQPYNYFTIEMHITYLFFFAVIVIRRIALLWAEKRYVCFEFNSLQALFHKVIKSSKFWTKILVSQFNSGLLFKALFNSMLYGMTFMSCKSNLKQTKINKPVICAITIAIFNERNTIIFSILMFPKYALPYIAVLCWCTDCHNREF